MTILRPSQVKQNGLNLTEQALVRPRLNETKVEDLAIYDGLAVSEQDYWEHYYQKTEIVYEWNHGILEAKPMANFRSALIFRWFLSLLEQYLALHPVAQVTLQEIGFRLALLQKTTIRQPDLGLILLNNLVQMDLLDCRYLGIFDICIELLSHSSQKEIERDTIDKKLEYELIGVQEYYILDDRGVETAFYERGPKGFYQPLPQPQGVVQSKVLAGFQLRISDLYDRPSLIDLVDDPVYQGFVWPEYRAERTRADQAERRAEAEAKARQAEAQTRRAEMISTIQRVLALRFNLEPEHFTVALQALNLAGLQHLNEVAFTAETLVDFETALKGVPKL